MWKWFLTAGVLCIGLSTAVLQANDLKDYDGKRITLTMTRGQQLTGTVAMQPDGSIRLTTDTGIAVTLQRAQIARWGPAADKPETPNPAGAPVRPGERRRLTAAEIEEVLGSDNVELGPPDVDQKVDLRAELPADEYSVQEMLRIAGPKAKAMHFPHYVLVYTSTPEMARQLGARLESVYEWHVRYMEMLDLPQTVLPDAKLEIFFFGTHAEYEAYQTLNGWSSMGAIGFYMRTNNRSAFFDMWTWPPYERYLREMNDPQVPLERRQYIRGWMRRKIEHENIEVIQHEAAHHIQFNIGVFPKSGDIPRWQSEGLATMFEFPPSDVGASLGAINHYRLYHFRNTFGQRGENLPPMRNFILNDGLFFQLGFHGYSIGWALNHYFLNRKREQYKRWMALMGQRDDDWTERVSISDKAAQFEEIFGAIDDQWVKDFNDYIAGIQIRTSLLPPQDWP